MAQTRAGRLAPVVGMAEKAEKTAAQRLGHFQGQVRLAESKLADLEAFRLDYQEQWIVRGSGGVSGQWLLGYQGFLAQLGTAIDQQRQSLAWHQNNLNKARKPGSRHLPGSKVCANWCSATRMKRGCSKTSASKSCWMSCPSACRARMRIEKMSRDGDLMDGNFFRPCPNLYQMLNLVQAGSPMTRKP
jgi:hypothetical protein